MGRLGHRNPERIEIVTSYLTPLFLVLGLIFSAPASAYSIERLANQAIRQAIEGTSRSSAGAHYEAAPGRFSVTLGQENPECIELHAFGAPRTPSVEQPLYTCRTGYASFFDPGIKSPRWVVERLDGNNLDGGAKRKGITFQPDPQIPRFARVMPEDYRGSGYDKGHLAPAADFRASATAMEQTFFLSNIVPQDAKQNRSIWANLEAAVREMASRRGTLYVITGPVYQAPVATIGRGIPVPSALYKVIIDKQRGEMTAFVIPNNPDTGDDPARYQTAVRNVERATGINFNPSLSRQDADRLEVAGGSWLIPRVRVKFND